MTNYLYRRRSRKLKRPETSEYPWPSILLAVLLLYAAPFVSRWLAMVSFLICLYRVIRYDARVFAADYGMLLPLVSLTNAPGTPALLIYLCLLAGIWYVVKDGIRADASTVLLIVLMNYLLTRMQLDINAFVLCFGQLFALCMLLPKQDGPSAERTVKMFVNSLAISSIYAFLLRNTGPIRAICGADSYAIWGTDIMRFKGLFQDPNYYTTMLIIGLALLLKLKDCNMLRTGQFVVQAGLLAAFGALTYSKTFFLVFLLLGCIYILWQFRSGRYGYGILLTVLAAVTANFLLFSEWSPFSVVILRLDSANNLRDLTTGRTELFLYYWEEISRNFQSFFFGKGMAAEGLARDPHNIYLEAVYYLGIVGLLLIVSVYFALVQETRQRLAGARKQHFISKYMVLFIFLLLFTSLHGIFQALAYGEIFLAILSLLLAERTD